MTGLLVGIAGVSAGTLMALAWACFGKLVDIHIRLDEIAKILRENREAKR